jgi:DNA-directed RNA polymerase subunit F
MSEHYISLAEVKELLTADNEIRELLTTQKAAMEHAQTVSPLTTEEAKEIIAAVMTVNQITEPIAVKIADLLPQSPEEVRAILSKERITLEPAQTEQILETVAKYL